MRSTLVLPIFLNTSIRYRIYDFINQNVRSILYTPSKQSLYFRRLKKLKIKISCFYLQRSEIALLESINIFIHKNWSFPFYFFSHTSQQAGSVTCRILVPQLMTELSPAAMKAQHLNHWTPREVQHSWLWLLSLEGKVVSIIHVPLKGVYKGQQRVECTSLKIQM